MGQPESSSCSHLSSEICPDFLDQTILRKEPFVLTVNPAVADFACEDFSGKSAELLDSPPQVAYIENNGSRDIQEQGPG